MAKHDSNDTRSRALDRAAGKLRRRIFCLAFFLALVAAAGVALFAAGAAVLALRFGFALASIRAGAISGVPLFAAAVAAALVRARLVLPARRVIACSIDEASGAGGCFLAAEETDLSPWEDRFPEIRIPEVALSHRPAWIPLAAGACFFAGALLVPVSAAHGRESFSLDLADEQSDLRTKLETVESEKLSTPAELAEIRESFRSLDENRDARDPAKSYELLEAMEKKLDAILRKSSTELLESSRTLSLSALAAETLAGANPGASKAALEEFSQMLERLAEADTDLASALAACEGSLQKLDRETLEKLARELRKNAGELEERLKRLERCAGGKCVSEAEKTAARADAAALAEWLRDNAPEADELAGALTNVACDSPEPGSGGVSRGRADADLEFTGETPDLSLARRDISVGSRTPPQGGKTVATFLAAPDGSEETIPAVAGNLRVQAASPVRAAGRTILPEHRAAVKRYFTTIAPEERKK